MSGGHKPPSKLDFARSALPYLSPFNPRLAGGVAKAKTEGGLRYVIYTPPGYGQSDETYPVLYHLHGAGSPWPWVHKDVVWTAEQHEAAVVKDNSRPMVIVAPHDASKFSMWTDTQDTSNRVATSLYEDLIPTIQSKYRVRTDRASTLLQGFSMGGFGAALHALKHQDRFAALAIFDGALHDWVTLTDTRPKIAANQFSNEQDWFRQWSPWEWPAKANAAETPVFLVSGLLVEFADRYTRLLADAGFSVERHTTDCGHDLRCLQHKVGSDALAFFNAVIGTDR